MRVKSFNYFRSCSVLLYFLVGYVKFNQTATVEEKTAYSDDDFSDITILQSNNQKFTIYRNAIKRECYVESMQTPKTNSDQQPHSRTLFLGNLKITSKDPIYKELGQDVLEFCKNYPMFTLEERFSSENPRREKRQVMQTKKPYFKGQTQTQFISFDNEGKNDKGGSAEATVEQNKSRAIVQGRMGMGQAQSQSGSEDSCEECAGSVRTTGNFGPTYFDTSYPTGPASGTRQDVDGSLQVGGNAPGQYGSSHPSGQNQGEVSQYASGTGYPYSRLPGFSGIPQDFTSPKGDQSFLGGQNQPVSSLNADRLGASVIQGSLDVLNPNSQGSIPNYPQLGYPLTQHGLGVYLPTQQPGLSQTGVPGFNRKQSGANIFPQGYDQSQGGINVGAGQPNYRFQSGESSGEGQSSYSPQTGLVEEGQSVTGSSATGDLQYTPPHGYSPVTAGIQGAGGGLYPSGYVPQLSTGLGSSQGGDLSYPQQSVYFPRSGSNSRDAFYPQLQRYIPQSGESESQRGGIPYPQNSGSGSQGIGIHNAISGRDASQGNVIYPQQSQIPQSGIASGTYPQQVNSGIGQPGVNQFQTGGTTYLQPSAHFPQGPSDASALPYILQQTYDSQSTGYPQQLGYSPQGINHGSQGVGSRLAGQSGATNAPSGGTYPQSKVTTIPRGGTYPKPGTTTVLGGGAYHQPGGTTVGPYLSSGVTAAPDGGSYSQSGTITLPGGRSYPQSRVITVPGGGIYPQFGETTVPRGGSYPQSGTTTLVGGTFPQPGATTLLGGGTYPSSGITTVPRGATYPQSGVTTVPVSGGPYPQPGATTQPEGTYFQPGAPQNAEGIFYPQTSGFKYSPGTSFIPQSTSNGQPNINYPRNYLYVPATDAGNPNRQDIPDSTSNTNQIHGGGKGVDISFGSQITPIDTASGESQSLSSLNINPNGTNVAASAQGKTHNGMAQAEVSGTYTGSFSAQALTSDNEKSVQTQIFGNTTSASSSSQGKAGKSGSQSQILYNYNTGVSLAESQGSGINHNTNTQIQAGNRGGIADAQSTGSGSTSSQAQIGFLPLDPKRKDQTALFEGGGISSSQNSALSGQSQTQLQGSFRAGLSFTGSAQSSSGKAQNKTKLAFSSSNLSFPIDDATKPPSVLSEQSGKEVAKKENDIVKSTVPLSSLPQNDQKDFTKNTVPNSAASQYQDATIKSRQYDAYIDRDSSDKKTSFNAGDLVPGTDNYRIPIGFRGKVSSTTGDTTHATATSLGHAQSQTVLLKPGKGRVTISNRNRSDQPNSENDSNLLSDKNFAHRHYTKSSKCGYFSFTCDYIEGSNERTKICKPGPLTYSDGTPCS